MTIVASTLTTATEQGHSLMAGMAFGPAAELTARDGVIAGLELTKTSGMGWQLGIGRAGVQWTSQPTAGVVPFAVIVAETGSFDAGDSVKDRIDSIVAKIDAGTVVVDVVKGSLPSAGAPVAPALPDDAIRLHDVLIEAGTSAGAGGWDPANATDRRNWAVVGASAGDIKFTAAASAPNGWLIAGGQTVSRTIYAALFAAIGTVYGAGDGSTTFGLPDLRGRVPVGVLSSDARFGVLGQKSGEADHVLTIAELAPHRHTVNFVSSGFTQGGAWGAVNNDQGTNLSTSSTGGGAAHNNVQPSLALTPLIKS